MGTVGSQPLNLLWNRLALFLPLPFVPGWAREPETVAIRLLSKDAAQDWSVRKGYFQLVALTPTPQRRRPLPVAPVLMREPRTVEPPIPNALEVAAKAWSVRKGLPLVAFWTTRQHPNRSIHHHQRRRRPKHPSLGRYLQWFRQLLPHKLQL